ncbi:LysR substrate-binding domain-containing protein [Streptomyces parvulus]|uniref:LysR substrate-binding domain-containing protein n=1 Tax=Streptomyces parvulus TaxID=146923 RepID=UPI0037CDAE28
MGRAGGIWTSRGSGDVDWPAAATTAARQTRRLQSLAEDFLLLARLDTSFSAANPEAFDLTADGDLHVVRGVADGVGDEVAQQPFAVVGVPARLSRCCRGRWRVPARCRLALTPPAFGACFELRLPRAVGCDDACAELGLTRHVVGTAPTEAAAFAFARDSDLLVTVPDITVRPADTVAGLTVLALPVELPPAPVYLSWHQRYDTDPAHVWLRDLARTALASCAEAGGPLDGAAQGAGR